MKRLCCSIGIIIVFALAISGCQRNSISSHVTPIDVNRVKVFFSIRKAVSVDSVFASNDTIPIGYELYIEARDTLTLVLADQLPVSVDGAIRPGESSQTAASFSRSVAKLNTAMNYGTDTTVKWLVAKSDTGRAEITVTVFSTTGTLLSYKTRTFFVDPAPQQ